MRVCRLILLLMPSIIELQLSCSKQLRFCRECVSNRVNETWFHKGLMVIGRQTMRKKA